MLSSRLLVPHLKGKQVDELCCLRCGLRTVALAPELLQTANSQAPPPALSQDARIPPEKVLEADSPHLHL